MYFIRYTVLTAGLLAVGAASADSSGGIESCCVAGVGKVLGGGKVHGFGGHEGKPSSYRLWSAHLSKTAKGAAASVVVVPA